MSEQLLTAIRKLSKLQAQSVLLQRYALLGEAKTLEFDYAGQDVSLYLPNADRDEIQGDILTRGTFYEDKLLAELSTQLGPMEGQTVVDIGANIGNHTVYFGLVLKPSTLYAFEPQPKVHAILKRNVELNLPGDKTHLFDCAVGASRGQADWSRSVAGNLGMASFSERDGGSIQMQRLDEVLPADQLETVGFMKIDVEGNEAAVLAGATEVLARSRPFLWIEIMPRNSAAVDDILTPLGYQKQKLNRLNFFYHPPR